MKKRMKPFCQFIAILLVFAMTFTSSSVWGLPGVSMTSVDVTVSQAAEAKPEAQVIYASQAELNDFRDETISISYFQT